MTVVVSHYFSDQGEHNLLTSLVCWSTGNIKKQPLLYVSTVWKAVLEPIHLANISMSVMLFIELGKFTLQQLSQNYPSWHYACQMVSYYPKSLLYHEVISKNILLKKTNK